VYGKFRQDHRFPPLGIRRQVTSKEKYLYGRGKHVSIGSPASADYHRAPHKQEKDFSPEKIIISGFFHSRKAFSLIVKNEQY
jgi:hypothetical protein